MSSNNATGVRNLRAMFENKASSEQSTSPPSRGRSPLNSETNGDNRPVSKVRASFVAVEKPGQPGQAPQWGLRKASDVSSISGNIEDSSLKRITTAPMAEQTAQGDLGLILKGSPFEDNKAPEARQGNKSHQSGKQVAAIDAKKDKAFTSKLKSPTSVTKPKPTAAQVDTSNTTQSTKATSKQTPKPSEKSPISPQSPQSAKVNTTHHAPMIRGIRGGPGKIMAVMESANKARAEREKFAMENKSPPATKKDVPKLANGAKKDTVLPKQEKSTPAIPTKLPAAATAPTAASVAKSEAPTKPVSENRRVSAVRKEKTPSKVAKTSTASSLAKRTSRSSLAPQTNGHDRPRSRVSTAKDESFLARMTRPTASSQQKVHEKVVKPDSPPRARKVSDKMRQSLGSAKVKGEDKENDNAAPLEATTPVLDARENAQLPTDIAVAQEAAS